MTDTNRNTVRPPNVARTDGVTKKKEKKDEREAISALSQYDAALAAAEERYRAQREALAAQRSADLRRASVNRTLLNKYLPAQNEAAGLSGLGVSESARIEANNAALRAAGEIESSYAADERALRADHSRTKEELIKHYGEAMRADQDDYLKQVLEQIKGEKFNTVKELDEMLSKAKSYLRPEQYAHLESMVKYYMGHSEYGRW